MSYDQLITAVWEGKIGEVEFIEVGLDLGLSPLQLSMVLNDIRREDGTL